MEEWELNNFITQEKYEELNSDHDFLEKDLKNIEIEDILQEKLENEIDDYENQEKNDNCMKEIIFENNCFENNCNELNESNIDNNNEMLNMNEYYDEYTDTNKNNKTSDIKLIDLKNISKTSKKNSSNDSIVSENKLKRIKNLKKSKAHIYIKYYI
jgi:hypothetical protein